MGQFEREVRNLFMDAAYGDLRTGSAAGALCLVRTNVELTDDTIENTINGLADVAKQYGLSPDEMQLVLERLDPVLGEEYGL